MASNELAARFLEVVDYGLYALADNASVLYSNACGREILADGTLLFLQSGRLVSGYGGGADFSAVVSVVTKKLEPRTLPLGGGAFVTFLPSPPGEGVSLAETCRAFAVVVHPDRSVATEAQLASSFGLTSAEARLVRALAQGVSPGQYASRLDVSITTVRSHLRAAMEKMGVRRQAHMVAMAAMIPPLRRPATAGAAGRFEGKGWAFLR